MCASFSRTSWDRERGREREREKSGSGRRFDLYGGTSLRREGRGCRSTKRYAAFLSLHSFVELYDTVRRELYLLRGRGGGGRGEARNRLGEEIRPRDGEKRGKTFSFCSEMNGSIPGTCLCPTGL